MIISTDLKSGVDVFNKKIIDQILVETDKNLTHSTDLVLIGGTALVLKYNSPRSTIDVDAYTKISKELKEAWGKAEKKIGVQIPLARSTIVEGPYNMEDRFVVYKDLGLKNLNILIPDHVDIVLMKVQRLLGKDRDDISHLIKQERIPHIVLLKRFTKEMDHVVGHKSTIISYYLLSIEENYGKVIADEHEQAIKKLWK